MSGYAVSHLDEIEKRDNWIPIRDHFGIAAFGVNAWRRTEAGEHVIPEHTELMAGHEELYLVVEGHAAFTVDGEEVDAPAGTLVFVADPDSRRGAVAREAGTTVLVIGAEPGEPFSISPWEESWEENQQAMALYREQRYADAAGVLREAVERYPRSAGLHYNLACFESMAGTDGETVAGHLRQAIELYPNFREFARGDSDFDAIKDEPAFKGLVGEP